MLSSKPFVKTNVTHVAVKRSVLVNPKMTKSDITQQEENTLPLLYYWATCLQVACTSNSALYIIGIHCLARQESLRNSLVKAPSPNLGGVIFSYGYAVLATSGHMTKGVMSSFL